MEEDFSEDLYWDLKELNSDAVVYTEYEQAFMGFTLKNGKYVAVYDSSVIEDIIARGLMENPSFLDHCFKEIDGKIDNKDVPMAVSRLANIEALKVASDLLGEWDNKENYPIMFFLPKVIQQPNDGGDEVFKYEQ